MKKTVALILVLLMTFTFTACGQSKESKINTIKQGLLEKVQDVMLDVSVKEGRTEDDVREAIKDVVVEYTDEKINGDDYTATATYFLTFKNSDISYCYSFQITGNLDNGEASMKLLNYYTAPKSEAE